MAIVNAAFAARHFEGLVEHARRMIHEPDPALDHRRANHFMEADKAGYWEQHGYHMRGDPFGEERFRQASTT